MTTRMQVTLDEAQHRRARERAAAMGISLAEYIRRLVAADLDDDLPVDEDITEIFGIGDSGGSDVAGHREDYLAEAVTSAHGLDSAT